MLHSDQTRFVDVHKASFDFLGFTVFATGLYPPPPESTSPGFITSRGRAGG